MGRSLSPYLSMVFLPSSRAHPHWAHCIYVGKLAPFRGSCKGNLSMLLGSIGFFPKPLTRWFVRRCVLVARSIHRTRCTLLLLIRRRVRVKLDDHVECLHGHVLRELRNIFYVSLLASSLFGVSAHTPVRRLEVLCSGPL